MKFGVLNKSLKYFAFTALIFSLFHQGNIIAQNEDFAIMKMSRIFIGVAENADKQTFNFTSGFFPNDYNVVGIRGQHGDATNGSGFQLGVVRYWDNPFSGLQDTIPIYGPVTEWNQAGTVITPLTNYIRYKYPQQEIDFVPVDLETEGTYDPSQFGDYTYDQVIEGTTEYLFGIEMHRKIMSWSQNFNDDYNIYELVFENKSQTTFDSLYISMQANQQNTHLAYGRKPTVPAGDAFNNRRMWQHYYGGRNGDSLRVFYEYSADDPDQAGDNMGAPVITQGGRLMGPDIFFQTFLHASEKPYSIESEDVDDQLQPKVTYVGISTFIPSNTGLDDQFGSKNAWAMVGGYSDYFPMAGDTYAGTHHGGNTDEMGKVDFSDFPAGSKTSINQKMFSVFGPYENFQPGQKIKIVYAVGMSGIGIKKAKEVGEKWLLGTLENPPNLPNPETGYLPSNFAYPIGATEMDKRKDKWLSTGIDSVMKVAYKAKWNFDHDYKIPQSPPPPEIFIVTGKGEGVEIKWKAIEAESKSNFAGYRIMRRLSDADTVFFESIYDSDANDLGSDHLYVDRNVLPGAVYYYYLQTKAKIDDNDFNADPSSRGKMLYSSRLLIPNIYNVQSATPSSDDMSKIRIVPNPYNINDPLLESAYGLSDSRQINFFNLPGTCTIKIFTENGDLIRTIEHNDPSQDGKEPWDMVTSSQQVISSGLYIAVFQKPNGEITYHKFLVVR